MSGKGSALNVRTVWSFDYDLLRKTVMQEKELRGVTFAQIQAETGVNFTQISTFVKGETGLGVHSLITLAKWANMDLRSLAKRQRNSSTHVVSAQERELRTLMSYLTAAGLDIQAGESPVDAAVRLLAQAKENAAFDDDEDGEE